MGLIVLPVARSQRTMTNQIVSFKAGGGSIFSVVLGTHSRMSTVFLRLQNFPHGPVLLPFDCKSEFFTVFIGNPSPTSFDLNRELLEKLGNLLKKTSGVLHPNQGL
jgi:hypothetical protein